MNLKARCFLSAVAVSLAAPAFAAEPAVEKALTVKVLNRLPVDVVVDLQARYKGEGGTQSVALLDDATVAKEGSAEGVATIRSTTPVEVEFIGTARAVFPGARRHAFKSTTRVSGATTCTATVSGDVDGPVVVVISCK